MSVHNASWMRALSKAPSVVTRLGVSGFGLAPESSECQSVMTTQL